MTHEIPFTQFLMPDGRQERTWTPVGEAEFAQWEKIRALGLRMTVELLSDWATVSMAIEDRDKGDFDLILAPNGPDVPVKLSEMLLRFDEESALKFIGKRKRQPVLEPLEKPFAERMIAGDFPDDGPF